MNMNQGSPPPAPYDTSLLINSFRLKDIAALCLPLVYQENQSTLTHHTRIW